MTLNLYHHSFFNIRQKKSCWTMVVAVKYWQCCPSGLALVLYELEAVGSIPPVEHENLTDVSSSLSSKTCVSSTRIRPIVCDQVVILILGAATPATLLSPPPALPAPPASSGGML